MANSGTYEWETLTEAYNPYQVESILDLCGVEIAGQTYTAFLCYCPYHSNRDTPAFAVNKTEGTFICFNGSCAETGNLQTLLRDIKGMNSFEARRLIKKRGKESETNWNERVILPDDEFEVYEQDKLDALRQMFLSDPAGKDYMHSRHFTDATLDTFYVGYDGAGVVTVPVHSPKGEPVGAVGRSIVDKMFKNSPKLPVSKTMFNLHRAKAHDSVIICESTFDAMRVHQAGYPNVVATLHGHVSPRHFQLLGRYFSTVIIMTDNDELQVRQSCGKCKKLGRPVCIGHNPGRDLGSMLAAGLTHKQVLWAAYGDRVIYPTEPLEGYRSKAAKDAGDMTDEEIRTCLRNAVSNFEYQDWA